MPTPTSHEYFRDVLSIAQDIVAEHGDNEDGISEAIHEYVDGSQWVIYTYRARKVLEFSSNDEAGPDELGWEEFVSLSTGWADLLTRGAYWAMSADVSEKVADLLTDAEHDEHLRGAL